MLSSDTLSQLATLKKDIRAGRDLQQGTVRATTGRFGFASLDDGREAFLNPEQMDRVFHGDRIEVTLTQNDRQQYEAKIEKLIYSPLKQIAGRYVVKGKGHFVTAEDQLYGRWIFVPPKLRAGVKEGSMVTARITQHPWETGRGQAKIVVDLGSATDVDKARAWTLALYQLFDGFPKDVMKQASALHNRTLAAQAGGNGGPRHANLGTLSFVTIDAASTRDMDDALAVESNDNGWTLHVAIADPGSEILPGTPLDTLAQRRAKTLYLPGGPVPMLPEILAHERYSLITGEDRPALVCTMEIDTSGAVSGYQWRAAIIRSQAKFSYPQVSALLQNKPYQPPPQLDDATLFAEQLHVLQNCTSALRDYRKKHRLLTDNRDEFTFVINGDGQLEAIKKLETTLAHSLVEEAMIVTNQCAGDYLANHQVGIFVSHPGYREERRQHIEKLLTETIGETAAENTRTLDGYVEAIQTLQADERFHPLLAIQQRFLSGSQLSGEARPHFGLGIAAYANVTSPIRRYQDLVNQRIIHQLINNGKTTERQAVKNSTLDRLNETLGNLRKAGRFMEQWLIAGFMKNKIGQTFTGCISLFTSQGIGIRLVDTGIEGFISRKKGDNKADKISFNHQRMELSWNGRPLYYDQIVTVKLAGVDMERKKLAFEWVEEIVSEASASE